MSLFDESPKQKLMEAWRHIAYSFPPWGRILMHCRFSESVEVRDMASTGFVVYYNLKWIKESPQMEVNYALLKVLTSIYLMHPLRQPRYPSKKDMAAWEEASALATNSLIKTGKMAAVPGSQPVPEKGSFVALKPNRPLEEYYEILRKTNDNDHKSDSGKKGGDNDPNGNKDASPSNIGGSGGDQDKNGESENSGNNSGSENKPNSDGGDGGHYNGSKHKDNDKPDDGEREVPRNRESDRSGPGTAYCSSKPRTEEQVSNEEQDYMTIRAEVHSEALSCGNSPGWLMENARAAIQPPQVNWKTKLKRGLTQTIHDLYNFNRLSRRSAWRKDVLMPSNYSKTIKDVIIIIDTSGSMDKDRMMLGVYEAFGVLSAFKKVKVHIIQCDVSVKIAGIGTYTSNEKPDLSGIKFYGRGGTNLSPAIVYAIEKFKNPSALLICSDMEWSVKSAPKPKFPVFWLHCGRRWTSEANRHSFWGSNGHPSFGTVIRIEP